MLRDGKTKPESMKVGRKLDERGELVRGVDRRRPRRDDEAQAERADDVEQARQREQQHRAPERDLEHEDADARDDDDLRARRCSAHGAILPIISSILRMGETMSCS